MTTKPTPEARPLDKKNPSKDIIRVLVGMKNSHWYVDGFGHLQMEITSADGSKIHRRIKLSRHQYRMESRVEYSDGTRGWVRLYSVRYKDIRIVKDPTTGDDRIQVLKKVM